MKNILIVADSLSTGGLEKTLIDLCNNLDYTKYNVDLYLFNEGRDLLPQLNKKASLLPDSPYFAAVYNKSVGASVKTLLKQKQFALAFYRVLRFLKARLKIKGLSNLDWHFQKKTMLKIDKEYDSAIAFAEAKNLGSIDKPLLARVRPTAPASPSLPLPPFVTLGVSAEIITFSLTCSIPIAKSS